MTVKKYTPQLISRYSQRFWEMASYSPVEINLSVKERTTSSFSVENMLSSFLLASRIIDTETGGNTFPVNQTAQRHITEDFPYSAMSPHYIPVSVG